jgi:serine/threonine protein kinase
MGLVFLGEHTLLGRRAAIKTLLPTVAANHEIVERFFNEARATSSIADPGVIQIFDFGYHVDGTAYIVMELLEGESLSARLERCGSPARSPARSPRRTPRTSSTAISSRRTSSWSATPRPRAASAPRSSTSGSARSARGIQR